MKLRIQLSKLVFSCYVVNKLIYEIYGDLVNLTKQFKFK